MARLSTLLLVTLLLLTGCGGSGNDSSPTGPSATIGVSTLTLTHVFHQDLAEAFQAAADSLNFEVILVSSEFDVARQQNQVSDFIVQGVDAIVLMPADSKAIGTSIQAAQDAGIPVFTADIAALDEAGGVVTHIATDNYAGGRLAAEAVIEAIGTEGEVAIIDHPEVESVIQRTRGFTEVIEATNADGGSLDIVAQLSGGGTKDRAFRVAEDLLQAHPNLAAIFGINDDSALGAVAAIEKAGKEGQIMVVGFDGTQEAREAIQAGKIYADVIQHPGDIGRRVALTIDQYLNGESVPPEILIPASLYGQDD
ncbi:MAG: substrate-binding domain-containing protein [Rhodothermales bacterium]